MHRNHQILEKMIANFLYPQGVSPGIVIAYGNKKESIVCCRGENGAGSLLTENTLLDMASITKLFLAIIYMYLYERGVIDIDAAISSYTDKYYQIRSLRIRDLMGFNVELETKTRIDECRNAHEAIRSVRDMTGIYSMEQIYSDMPALVLSDIIKDITGKEFADWMNDLFVAPLGLNHTKWGKVDLTVNDCMDYSGEKWLLKNELLEKDNPCGIVNDPKARVLMDEMPLAGHAGLFCSVQDISVICRAILEGRIITSKSLYDLAEGNGWQMRAKDQTYGFMCYRKYENRLQSEIPHFLSSSAIAATGFTGTYIMIDIMNGIYVFLGGNRLWNSVSKNTTSMKPADGRFYINGKYYQSSLNFVYERDEIKDLVCEMAMVYFGNQKIV